MMTNKTMRRKAWIELVLEKKEEVDNNIVQKEETKEILMYYQKNEKKPGQYRKNTNVLSAL